MTFQILHSSQIPPQVLDTNVSNPIPIPNCVEIIHEMNEHEFFVSLKWFSFLSRRKLITFLFKRQKKQLKWNPEY